MSRLKQAKPLVEALPIKLGLYGIEGVGKSTTGARAEKPIFISAEGGVPRGATPMPDIHTFQHILEAVEELRDSEHDFRTLVLDSADWIEKLCHAQIIGNSGKSIITVNGGYGTGYRQSEQMHRHLISLLDQVREKKRMHVIVTAHYAVRQVKDPEMIHDYDEFGIKCHDMVSALWREWVDALVFVRFATHTVVQEGAEKARAIGEDKRVAYMVKRPAFQAKNRYGLPPVMDFTLDFWEQLTAHVYGKSSTDVMLAHIQELKARVSPELLPKIDETVGTAGRNLHALTQIRDRLASLAGATA